MAAAAAAYTIPLLLALLLLSSPAATLLASAACASEKFSSGRAYATCEDLPKLGASLHWTYDASKASLSVAFVAAPAGSGGWVAWGINPTGDGMAGAQALVALAGSGSAPTVKTYNISGYGLGAPAALEFPATELAADASGGKIRVYGKLQLGKGTLTKTGVVNQVWQVGSSVTKGVPDKHAFGADNLSAKGKLVLAGKAAAAGAPAASPVPAPEAGGPAGPGDGGAASSSTAPSAGKTPNAAVAVAGVSAPALIAMAAVGFLVAV